MNILIYYESNNRTVAIESIIFEFQQLGHTVLVLTQKEKGHLHDYLEAMGIDTYAFSVNKSNPIVYYFKHCRYLIKFIKKNQIDLVFSHIQQPNFVAAIAQYFVKSRIVLCRHHSDCAYLDNNWKEKVTDWIINKLGKEFIVPSLKVKEQMLKVESVDPKKVKLIRYGYDFSQYPEPNLNEVQYIRNKYQADHLLVSIARLIPEKRHNITLKVMNRLVKEGNDVKLLIVSEGPEKDNLINLINSYGLKDRVFLLGFKSDIMNYLASSDWVVHLSVSEASNSLIKEAALIEKNVILIKGVGDFDEYISHGKEAIKLSMNNTEEELYDFLKNRAFQESFHLGNQLKSRVLETFDVKKIISEYKNEYL